MFFTHEDCPLFLPDAIVWLDSDKLLSTSFCWSREIRIDTVISIYNPASALTRMLYFLVWLRREMWWSLATKVVRDSHTYLITLPSPSIPGNRLANKPKVAWNVPEQGKRKIQNDFFLEISLNLGSSCWTLERTLWKLVNWTSFFRLSQLNFHAQTIEGIAERRELFWTSFSSLWSTFAMVGGVHVMPWEPHHCVGVTVTVARSFSHTISLPTWRRECSGCKGTSIGTACLAVVKVAFVHSVTKTKRLLVLADIKRNTVRKISVF